MGKHCSKLQNKSLHLGEFSFYFSQICSQNRTDGIEHSKMVYSTQQLSSPILVNNCGTNMAYKAALELSPVVVTVVSIGLLWVSFMLFLCNGMECVSNILSFLLVTSQLVKKVPMEKVSSISLGWTIILLALFVPNYIFKQRYTLSRPTQSLQKEL